MKFILIPIVSMVVCQIIKFVIYFWRGGKLSTRSIFWEGFWVAKYPSSHSSLIASSLYLLWANQGTDAIFGFAFVVSLIFIYKLLEDKKRQEILESYIAESKDDGLRKIVSDRALYDFNGHTFFEVISGIIVGLAIAISFV